MPDGMKQLNVYFNEAEYNKLYKIKKKIKLSWHDVIMLLAKPEIPEVIGTENATD